MLPVLNHDGPPWDNSEWLNEERKTTDEQEACPGVRERVCSASLRKPFAGGSGHVKRRHLMNSATTWVNSVWSPHSSHLVGTCDGRQTPYNAQQQRSQTLLTLEFDMEQKREAFRSYTRHVAGSVSAERPVSPETPEYWANQDSPQ